MTKSTTARVVDLDAKRLERAAARAEAKEQAVVVRLGGEDYDLPAELPLDVIGALGSLGSGELDGLQSSIEALLGPDNWPKIQKLGLSLPDALELLQGIAELYGVDPGESQASSGS